MHSRNTGETRCSTHKRHTHPLDELTYGDLVRIRNLCSNDYHHNNNDGSNNGGNNSGVVKVKEGRYEEETNIEIIPSRNLAACIRDGALEEVRLYLSASSSHMDLSTDIQTLSPRTALTAAAALGHSKVVVLLIDTGLYDVDDHNEWGRTARHVAVE